MKKVLLRELNTANAVLLMEWFGKCLFELALLKPISTLEDRKENVKYG